MSVTFILDSTPALGNLCTNSSIQALIKERWQHLNMALDLLIEQQKAWRVPDQGLRANLRDAIIEDFVSAYKVILSLQLRLCSWQCCYQRTETCKSAQ